MKYLLLILFMLLGNTKSIAAYKIWENSQSINELITYINYSKKLDHPGSKLDCKMKW